jgi:hemerythrin-like metal-binding protein
MAIEWSDKLKIRNDKIDDEHRKWFQLANVFLMADAEKSSKECGRTFFRYTQDHFHCEEVLMREVNFPYRDIHVRAHESLLDTLGKVLDVVGKSVLSKEELEDFLGYSLARHIATHDVKFVAFTRRGLGTAA